MTAEGQSLPRRRQFENSYGDVWAATWADDGNLYALSDDTGGFDEACWSNVALNCLVGETVESLRGRTVNSLPQFGAWAETGPDGATWKGTGIVSVGAELYLAASRHKYGSSPHYIQYAWDASIFHSSDHGQSWSGLEGVVHFPGRTFSNPGFVQTGQAGSAPAEIDDGYLYAVSNDGCWNNGTYLTLARVPRDSQCIMDPNAWEYWGGRGPDENSIWTRNMDESEFVFRSPGRTSMVSITYSQSLGVYCMPQWHYRFDPARTDLDWPTCVKSTPTMLEFYTAPHPWGPWTLTKSVTSPEGWYNPCIITKPMGDLPPDMAAVLVAGLGGTDMQNYNLNVCDIPLSWLQPGR